MRQAQYADTQQLNNDHELSFRPPLLLHVTNMSSDKKGSSKWPVWTVKPFKDTTIVQAAIVLPGHK